MCVFDTCGVRTHALSDWRLQPAPQTAWPKCHGQVRFAILMLHATHDNNTFSEDGLGIVYPFNPKQVLLLRMKPFNFKHITAHNLIC